MATTPPLKDPFQGFQTLNEYTHIYKPATPTGAPDDPQLLILCSWAFAQPKHIAKYIRAYQVQFPDAQILVVQNDIRNMIWIPDRLQTSFFQPAVTAIRSYLSSIEEKSPRILLHMFSNGGAHSAVQLAQVYRESDANGKVTELPLSALVMDSCPAVPNIKHGFNALVTGLPKNPLGQYLGRPLIGCTMAVSNLLHYLGISELAVSKLWRMLNDPDSPFVGKDIPRTYIYSSEDAVIDSQDVERHAELARAAVGTKSATEKDLIRNVEFKGTQHVNHMSADPERYWRAVHDTWKDVKA